MSTAKGKEKNSSVKGTWLIELSQPFDLEQNLEGWDQEKTKQKQAPKRLEHEGPREAGSQGPVKRQDGKQKQVDLLVFHLGLSASKIISSCEFLISKTWKIWALEMIKL